MTRQLARRAVIGLTTVLMIGALGAPASAQPGPTRIRDIQGAAHRSPLFGQSVSGVPGVVTATRSNGFWFQDPTTDSNDATSEGLFVFTSTAPTVAVGDDVLVSGTVGEFRPGNATNNLTISQIVTPTISVQSPGATLPPATVIGQGGRVPPTAVIDDDANGDVEAGGAFQPATDGIDFYESLEGMRVQVNGGVVLDGSSGSTSFGEIPVLPDGGTTSGGPGVRTPRGGVALGPYTTTMPDTDDPLTDGNPERVFIDDGLVTTPAADTGDVLGTVIGVLDYSFGNFKLLATASPTVVSQGPPREVAAPEPTPATLSVASYNVENLDAAEPAAKFNAIAAQIVGNLASPDLLVLEEIQDNNGPTNDAVVDADQTYNRLISAIATAGGPTYTFRQINPVDDQDGGQPGGNIRVGFLFRTDTGLAFVDRPGGTSTSATTVSSNAGQPQLSASPGRVDPTNPAFNNSRKPLAGEFTYLGRPLFVLGNHFNSKGGDQPLFGRFQPPTRSSETQRVQQAAILNDFTEQILSIDPNAQVVAAGDFNDFEFSRSLQILTGTDSSQTTDDLSNLGLTLPPAERYDYVFEGNSQFLDHILVSPNLASRATFDVVHVNAEYSDQLSDHDPELARIAPADGQPQPEPVIPETPTAALLPLIAVALAGLAVLRRSWLRSTTD